MEWRKSKRGGGGKIFIAFAISRPSFESGRPTYSHFFDISPFFGCSNHILKRGGGKFLPIKNLAKGIFWVGGQASISSGG